MSQSRSLLFAVAVAAAALSRVVEHPWNIAPVGALALFAGAYCRNRFLALMVPLAVMAGSDIAIGLLRHDMAFYTFHPLAAAVYGCYLIYAMLGWGVRRTWQRHDRQQLMPGGRPSDRTHSAYDSLQAPLRRMLPVAAATLAASGIFFVVTNFGVWLLFESYPKTWYGLIECYTLAIPFYRNTLAGDLFYVAALFGGYELLRQYLPTTEGAGLLHS